MMKVKMMKIILVFLMRALTSGTTALSSVAAYSHLHSGNILFCIISQTSKLFPDNISNIFTLVKGDL